MFKKAKNTGKGYTIPFKNPLKYTLNVICPFGVDVENDWKWSAKFLMDMDNDDHYNFLMEMQDVEKHIENYLKVQYPTSYDELFVVQSFIPTKDSDCHCYFRARIPVKNGLSSTMFVGNSSNETKRHLTDDDLNHNSKVIIDIQCDNWWIVIDDDKKSVGYTFTINQITLI